MPLRICLAIVGLALVQPARAPSPRVSILAYHRFGPAVTDAMTVRTVTFRNQLEYLRRHGHPVVPLRSVVDYVLGAGPAPPDSSVVITVDDGHRSVVTEMAPAVREYQVPVTLFVYPSAISNASYAMTWDQLTSLCASGLFDVESHTYWHPNFRTERRRLTPVAYRAFAASQLSRSRTTLAARAGANADLLAWPFGIYDDELMALAHEAGYRAAFTLDRRRVRDGDNPMALPRFLINDGVSMAAFAAIVSRDAP